MASSSNPPEEQAMAPPKAQEKQEPWEYILRKYILMLATLVATVAYDVGFNPPGGVWQDTNDAAGHLAGEPIARTTSRLRYLVFFYCNATAFVLSILVIVLFLLLSIQIVEKKHVWIRLKPLRVLMVLDLLSFMAAFAAGTCRDMLTTVYTLVLMAAAILTYLTVQMALAWRRSRYPPSSDKDKINSGHDLELEGAPLSSEKDKISSGHDLEAEGAPPSADKDKINSGHDLEIEGAPPSADKDKISSGHDLEIEGAPPSADKDKISSGDDLELEGAPPSADKDNINSGHDLEAEGRLRKVLMLLSTFAVSTTYVAGLNSPGGFWDNTEGSHRAGDPILNAGHHKARARLAIFVCDTTAFLASLLTIMLLLSRKLHEHTVRSREMYGCILVALVGLLGAFAAGSSREGSPTTRDYLLFGMWATLVNGLGIAYCLCQQFLEIVDRSRSTEIVSSSATTTSNMGAAQSYQSRSLLLLLATFATAITYQAGLAPPGGVWQDNGDWHIAGDPILLTMNAKRYKTFLYCNSFAFAASLVTILLVMMQLLTEHRIVQSVMILELFGLIGAYAAGACREVVQSIYIIALAGAVLFYVVIHVTFFSLEQVGNDFYFEELKEVEKKRKLLYLLATLSTAMSYQAGLTPPGGFWLRDDEESRHHAGNPVLLFHHPRRYNAFFYCNSVSFMLSITTMILLVSPVLYRPAIRSYALTLCTVASLFCLMGAYATGSTQHQTTSVGIYILVALAFLILVVLLLTCLVRDYHQLRKGTARLRTADEGENMTSEERIATKRQYDQQKYLMLLGILVAGVTYQAGIDPPGGFWQSGDGHDAGSPVMMDTIWRHQRYLVFFFSNSISFATSIVIIPFLLVQWMNRNEWLHIQMMTKIVPLNLLALMVAYAAGSNRDWKTSVFVAALIIPVLVYVTMKVMFGLCTALRICRSLPESSNM